MLDLQERELFIEALRPPEGFVLDGAIGTTYSLDLVSLLVAPVAFTLFSLEDGDGGTPRLDPTVLLESLRRNVGKIAIFCQAGQTYLPSDTSPLFAYLEDLVVSVDPGTGGVFHPKVWVLRFSSPGDGVRYRLLCTSRNLTFDRCWDSVVCLEGPLTDRKVAYARNHPLGDLLAHLPQMVTGRGVSDRIHAMVTQFEQEVRRVDFEVPGPFESYRFWAGGVGSRGEGPLEDRCDRSLIVSPFCTPTVLEDLVGEAGDHILISRPEALACLPVRIWAAFKRVAILTDSADTEENNESIERPTESLTGLHAKIFVFDQGWEATVWTGSANATASALKKTKAGTERNVEFLVGLMGRRSECGVDAILGPRDGSTTLSDLIADFPRPEKPAPPEPENAALDEARNAIARADLRVAVVPVEGTEGYRLVLSAPHGSFLTTPRTKATCWPVSLGTNQAQALGSVSAKLAFGPVGLDGITSFFAFDVKATGSDEAAIQFVLNLAIDGVPSDRNERLLRCVLKDQDGVARFIGFLLAADDDVTVDPTILPASGGSGDGRSREAVHQLFEQLVRTLHRNPARLDAVERFIEDLGKDPEGARILPPGFDLIWKPILEARKRPRP